MVCLFLELLNFKKDKHGICTEHQDDDSVADQIVYWSIGVFSHYVGIIAQPDDVDQNYGDKYSVDDLRPD